MADTYTLYGSYASYYTAKVRAVLRKRGIPFVERLPSTPRFREHVRPLSGTHRIPQLETPDGTVLQDSIAILDHLEQRHPDLPALPPTPRQRLAVHLMELLGSEGLVRLAWQHRWGFAENDFFVKMDFGRAFRPQGSDEELMKYGNVIAERMLSRGDLDRSESARAAADAEYKALLALLEAHLRQYPYMLAGHPSAADYALMGALHAHMGRDPAGLRLMQDHAPRVFRWVEHMLMPEVVSPECFETPVIYPADDALPETFSALLKYLVERYAGGFVINALAWAAHAQSLSDASEGSELAAPGEQPVLPAVEVRWNDEPRQAKCNLYHAWVTQRAQRYHAAMTTAQRAQVSDLLAIDGIQALLGALPDRWIERRQDNRLVLGARAHP